MKEINSIKEINTNDWNEIADLLLINKYKNAYNKLNEKYIINFSYNNFYNYVKKHKLNITKNLIFDQTKKEIEELIKEIENDISYILEKCSNVKDNKNNLKAILRTTEILHKIKKFKEIFEKLENNLKK